MIKYKIPQELDHGKNTSWGTYNTDLEFYCALRTMYNIYKLLEEKKKKKTKNDVRIIRACKRIFKRNTEALIR